MAARPAGKGSGEKGFSTIGLLVALTILGMAGTAFLSGVWTSSRTAGQTERMANMENLARAQMEYVKNYPFQANLVYPRLDDAGNPDAIAVPQGYSINVVAASLYEGDLQRITVAVSRGGQTRTVVGYKLNQ